MTQEMTASPAEMIELLETHQDGSLVSNKNLKIFCEKCLLTRELFLLLPIPSCSSQNQSPFHEKMCFSGTVCNNIEQFTPIQIHYF